MNEDRLAGTARNLGGQMEEGVGRATGDGKASGRYAPGSLRTGKGGGGQHCGSRARECRRCGRLRAHNHRAASLHGGGDRSRRRLSDRSLRPPAGLLESSNVFARLLALRTEERKRMAPAGGAIFTRSISSARGVSGIGGVSPPSTILGSRIVKVDPWPGLLATVMSPPII